MLNNRYFLIFIVLLALIELSKKLFLDSCKDVRWKKKIFIAISIFNALILAGFVWSIFDFKLYWVFFAIFFLPIFLATLINIMTIEFCASCGLTIHKYKFWKPFEGCPVCKSKFTEQS